MGEFFLKLLQVLIISMIKPFAEALAKKLFERFSKKEGKENPTLTHDKRKKGRKSK